MRMPTPDELQAAIVKAARRALEDLFSKRASEHFYYCSLITTGEAHAPFLVAWSVEALREAADLHKGVVDVGDLKWSYADSPYFQLGAQYFDEVNRLFDARPSMNHNDLASWRTEYELRLTAMEGAIRELDASGIFGRGADRLRIVVNVEVMPPDRSNIQRAMRLNPAGALVEWLAEIADPL